MQRRFNPAPLPAVAPLPVVLVGLGAIGCEVARLLLTKRSLKLVGVVDVDPAKQGRDLADFLDLATPTGLVVGAAPPQGAVLALHSTQSFMPDVAPQLFDLIDAGLSVVSSTEELSFPALQHPQLARELEARARERGVRVLGTGVNPGYVMDTLPLLATAAETRLERVTIERVVDASRRRYNLQKKIGAGMTVSQFEEAMATGRMGHVGLLESVALLAHGLGWELDRIEEELGPALAEAETKSAFFSVPVGGVTGLRQTAIGYRNGSPVVELRLHMALGAAEPRDATVLEGAPAMQLQVPGGIMGDLATAAMLVNVAPRLMACAPGLKTMLDVPLPRWIP